MSEVILHIMVYLSLAILLGIVIGYFLGKNNCPRNRPQIITKKETIPIIKKDSNKTKIPTLLSQPREGDKDNLQLIKGVGPVLERVLNQTGIYHFDQIANLTPQEIAWLNTSIAFPGRIEREDWIAQAKSLYNGVATEYSKRVKSKELKIKKS